jgi:hypothetical protein
MRYPIATVKLENGNRGLIEVVKDGDDWTVRVDDEDAGLGVFERILDAVDAVVEAYKERVPLKEIKYVRYPLLDTQGGPVAPFDVAWDLELSDYSDKHWALAVFLEVELDDINEVSYDEDHFEIGDAEYWVLTDDEADDAWDESLDNYIDECILPELPDFAANYFDEERWKRDARIDGRGHSLSLYDGAENDVEFNGETYYIYRTN